MFSWIKDMWGGLGTAKDALTDPVETSGNVMKKIVDKMSPAVQRIIVLGLIILALFLGADIGIDYQKQQIEAVPLPLTEVLPVNPNVPPVALATVTDMVKVYDVWTPILSAIALPEAHAAVPERKERTVNFKRPRPAAAGRGNVAKIAPRASPVAVQAQKHIPGARHAAKAKRPVARYATAKKRNNYRVWRPLLTRELSSSGIGGY